MKRIWLVPCSVAFLLTNTLLASCSSSLIHKNIIIDTNFSDDLGILTKTDGVTHSDFETTISLRKTINLDRVVILDGSQKLRENVDFYYTFNSYAINLYIYGSAITDDNVSINLYLKDLNVDVDVTDNKAELSTKKVICSQEYRPVIKIDKAYHFESVLLETKSKHFLENIDYIYDLDETNNLVYLNVFQKSIADATSLKITITLSKTTFNVGITTNVGVNIAKLMNEKAYTNEDYSTVIQCLDLKYEFTKVNVFVGQVALVQDVDYFVDWADDFANLTVKGSAITKPEITVDVQFKRLNVSPIPLSNLNTEIVWIPERFCNKAVLTGLGSEEVSDHDALRIPDSIYEVKAEAFNSTFTKDSERLTIKNWVYGSKCTLEHIQDKAFYGCNAFEASLTFPDSLTYIGKQAFSGTSFIGELAITKNIEFIGDSAFENCSSFTSISFQMDDDLPDNLNIGERAFAGTVSVNKIDLTCYKSIPKWATKEYGSKDIFQGLAPNGTVYVKTDRDAWEENLKKICLLPQTWDVKLVIDC